MPKACPFCDLKSIGPRVILRTKHAFIVPTNIPIVPGHVLICPIRHRKTLNDLTPAELRSIFGLQKKLKVALRKLFQAEGFNYAWNENPVAGQSVAHFHLHMLPRKEGDAGITKYEPRKFLYRPGSREAMPEQELAEVAKLIRSVLPKSR